MNYTETCQYLFERLPMYQRIGGAAYKADLNNTLQLCKLLGNPETQFKSVHVAGTNGKGSTSNLLASILQEAGYKTGLYTSPHYRDFRERIKINGQMIPEDAVVDFIEKWKKDFENIDLSFFEMTVGMAFSFFADQKVDVAIIEVGMGGRLDSTNVITPLASVITNIGFDHMQYLGNSLAEIAAEKAGIIKSEIPVVIGETQPEIKSVFEQFAKKHHALLSFADKNWVISRKGNNQKDKNEIAIYHKGDLFLEFNFPLFGSYQLLNLATTLETILSLQNSGVKISKEAIKSGIEHVIVNTGIMGRWQTIGLKPLIICDSGHNADGISKVVENIRETPHENLHFVIGVVNDKHLDGILNLLPKEATYYFAKADIPRGMPSEKLAAEAASFGLHGNSYSSVEGALNAAKANANSGDLIFVGGSTFVVAEVV